MAENNDCLDSFGIDDLLDFSNEEIAGAIGVEDDMQQQSADSSVTAENFSSRQQAPKPPIKPISLIDRDFTVPTPAVDFEWLISGFGSEESCYGSSSSNSSSKFLLGSAREEAEKENITRRVGVVASPVSVLESCATSERPAMISVGAAAPAPPARSKRGRPITPSTRILLSSTSSAGAGAGLLDDDEEFEEEEDDDDEEASEGEPASSDDDEEEDEEEGSMESDCALSTESEVVTEDDFRPAKRPCHVGNRVGAPVRGANPVKVRAGYQVARIGGGGYQVKGGLTVVGGGLAAAAPLVEGGEERRCTHCQSQKTPQWRAGPMGPKTLCNACGVRFKSGRLLPEYRPAGSPSFSSAVHSNSHRRVLEMRRQREAEVMRRLKAEAEVEVGEIFEA